MRNTWTGKFCLSAAALIAALVISPAAASASSFTIDVGYADGLRGAAYFPGQWYGDAGVQYFDGNNPSQGGVDAGAVRITNTGSAALMLNGLQVVLRPNNSPILFDLWNGFIGGGLSLSAGMSAIFTQTAFYNFDSSDYEAYVSPSLTDNCSTGPSSTGNALCVANPPQVKVNIDGGGYTTYLDTGHVLDTAGFDTAVFGNESLNWRQIGTSGIENPGGAVPVPEPTSMMLMGSGVMGLVLRLRRRRSARG